MNQADTERALCIQVHSPHRSMEDTSNCIKLLAVQSHLNNNSNFSKKRGGGEAVSKHKLSVLIWLM